MKSVFTRSMLVLAAIASGSGAARAAVLFDFNSSDGGFVSASSVGMEGPFVYNPTGGLGLSGSWTAFGQGVGLPTNATTTLTSPALTVQSNGGVSLSFDHMFSFEGGFWDGGAVFTSVNGGAFTYVGSASFTTNGYTGTVLNWGPGVGQSDLADLEAFVQDSPDRANNTFINSAANLGTFVAGDLLQVQFMSASDTNTTGPSNPQWSIDNVTLTNVVPEPGSALLAGIALALPAMRRRRTA